MNTSRLSYPPSASVMMTSPTGAGGTGGGGGGPGSSSQYSLSSQQQLLLPIPETEMETLSLDQLQEMKDILSYDIRKIEEVSTL